MRRVPARINHNLPSGWALPRGWQAYAIFGLLPVWWLIGLSAIMWVLIAIPLLATLVIRGGLKAPRRFGIWLLLLLWIGGSGFELTSSGRAIAWGWRASFYLAGTVLFLYLLNTPERRLPVRSIVNAVAFYWILVVIGGWAGVLFPTSPSQARSSTSCPGRSCTTPTCTSTFTCSSPRSSTSSDSRSAAPRRSSPTPTRGARRLRC